LEKFVQRLRVLPLLLIVVICVTVACQKRSDDSLATHVKANLFSDPTTKAANVNVAVKDGVVTLTGEVPSSDIELQAKKIADSTAGVKRVDDQIKVNAALAVNQPVPENSQPQTAPAATPQSQPEPASPNPAPVLPGAPRPETPPERVRQPSLLVNT
jgi:hypothetical protein